MNDDSMDNLDSIFDIEEVKITSTEIAKKKDDNEVIKPASVYKELSELVNAGKDVFEEIAAAFANTSDPELANATSTMLNSINNSLKEFNKVNIQILKHEQEIEKEELKQKNRLEILRLKHEREKSATDQNEVNEDLLKFSHQEVIDAILAK
jgi:hypothetical protein